MGEGGYGRDLCPHLVLHNLEEGEEAVGEV